MKLFLKEKFTVQLRRMHWLPLDFLLLSFSYFSALLVCSNLNIDSAAFKNGMAIFRIYGIQMLLISLLIFLLMGIYRRIWAYASLHDFGYLVFGCFVNSCAMNLLAVFFLHGRGVPPGMYVLLFFVNCGFVVAPRLWFRIFRSLKSMFGGRRGAAGEAAPTMIVGAGFAGKKLVADLVHYSEMSIQPICFIDDDKRKHGLSMNGIPVIGDREAIPEAVRRFRIANIIFVMPSAPPEQKKAILEICSRTGCKMFTVPSLRDILDNKVSINRLRNVDIADLLGRDETLLDLGKVGEFLRGKVIIVTGGGGSIGSELCRQIAGFSPRLLIVFDIYENNAYDFQQELKQAYPELPLKVLIGSVRDVKRLDEVFAAYRPEVVFHAAAHKHVPLMEDSPKEAIKNNVFGTFNTALAARKWGAGRFVLISSDKAVNPANVMGASKRLCEMVIQALNKPGGTEFVAVRFGNVLGSNGSVIPLFRRLIAAGRPLPVTHPDIVRYFMTIPEAARLVLQAGAIAGGGEIFILDMGKPVRIVELAEKLILLSGLRPYDDIRIEFCGLRPGEKLYEELSLAEEGRDSTVHEKIFISHQQPFDHDALLDDWLPQLRKTLLEDNEAALRTLLRKIVTTYRPA